MVCWERPVARAAWRCDPRDRMIPFRMKACVLRRRSRSAIQSARLSSTSASLSRTVVGARASVSFIMLIISRLEPRLLRWRWGWLGLRCLRRRLDLGRRSVLHHVERRGRRRPRRPSWVTLPPALAWLRRPSRCEHRDVGFAVLLVHVEVAAQLDDRHHPRLSRTLCRAGRSRRSRLSKRSNRCTRRAADTGPQPTGRSS
jgi:hypothetical protein